MEVPTEPLGIGDPPGEELLPGIPHDITFRHIATKLAWWVIPVLSSISRGWRLALRNSHQLYNGRVCSNSTETLAVISVELSDYTNAIALYSVRGQRLSYLPKIPQLGGFPLSCQCVSLGSKLYVLGGVKDYLTKLGSKEVYVLDLALAGEMEWRQCASMQKPRQDFGCCAMNGKIFVFGGSSALEPVLESEMYAPEEEDFWYFSPHTLKKRIKHRVTAVGNELVLHGGLKYKDSYVRYIRGGFPLFNFDDINLGLAVGYMKSGRRLMEFFNPETEEWRTRKAPALYGPWRDIVSVGQGKFYVVDSSNIHAYEIDDEISLTSIRSVSTASIFPSNTTICKPFVTTVVDGELLAILNWIDKEKGFPESGLVLSTGFSREDGEMVWQRAPWSGKHKPFHMNGIMCTIQL